MVRRTTRRFATGLAMVALLAAVGGLPNQPAVAVPLPSDDYCEARDGVVIEQRGDAYCEASEGNVAVAKGKSSASAIEGTGNEAFADGAGAVAIARLGDHNRADATGDHAFAAAGFGSRNRAEADGSCAVAIASSEAEIHAGARGDCPDNLPWMHPERGSTAVASERSSNRCALDKASFRLGERNSAVASGERTVAFAGWGCGNRARASGTDSFAAAAFGDRNNATAEGVCATAEAGGFAADPLCGSWFLSAEPAVSAAGSPSIAGVDGRSADCSPMEVLDTDPTSSSDRNTAKATGDDSMAFAILGCRNKAVAKGRSSVAATSFVEGDELRASGDRSCALGGELGAQILFGAVRVPCMSFDPRVDPLVATAEAVPDLGCALRPARGPQLHASSAMPGNNRVIATGENSVALAVGCSNVVTARGDFSVSGAVFAVDDVVLAGGDRSCATSGILFLLVFEIQVLGPRCLPEAFPNSTPSIESTPAGPCAVDSVEVWSSGNRVVASGSDSLAVAMLTCASKAIAQGRSSAALVFEGDRNEARTTSRATGAAAFAGSGDRNRAVARHEACEATALGNRQRAFC